MSRLWRLVKEKARRFWQWLRTEVLTRRMLVYLLIAELIFWSPAIVCGGFALSSPWLWAVVSAYVAFWAGPFTPATPIQLALAVLIKQLLAPDRTPRRAIRKFAGKAARKYFRRRT